MTRFLSLSILDICKSRYFFGLVLLYFCASLPAADGQISPYCSSFEGAGGTVSMREGIWNNVSIWLWSLPCEDQTCKDANTSCSLGCSGCAAFDGAMNLKVSGQGVNASAIPGFSCNAVNQSTGVGHYLSQCMPTNSLAGRSGYTLVFVVMDNTNATITTKTANISFVAGDVVVTKCLGSLENGTNKAYIGYDNSLVIYLMDDWNNSVGAKTGRSGIAAIPFTVEITWNPDDGTKVSLGQPATVDTRGELGYYQALIVPLKTGNYLAKIGVNTTMILNSPIAFQAIKGKKGSASFLRPLIFGSGVWGYGLSLAYMALVSAMAGNLM